MSHADTTQAAITLPPQHISFENVRYSYGEEDERPALNGVSLKVHAGEFLALVGANGSGKSTLSKMVNALIVPQSGTVLTLGLDTSTDDGDIIFEIRSQAGLVQQNPDSQIVASIVSDDIAFGPENLAVPHQEIVERVDEALDSVKMTEYALADPTRLSGGQKQRVCIAGLLAMRPRVLVLDEPGAMLDVRGRRGIRRVIGELTDAGLTVVLVTHFMEEAALAERVSVLCNGAVVLEGTPREVFAHGALLRDLGLDVPFSVQLAHALRSHGMEVPDIASPRELKETLSALVKTPQAAEQAAAATDVAKETFGEPLLPPLASKEAPDAQVVSEDAVLPSGATLRKEAPNAQVILLDDLYYYYSTSNTGKQKTPALKGINLSVGRGELLGVIGHTGSGKTTLLRIIAGLLKASSGRVQVAGVDLSHARKRSAFHTKVGMVFQYPERQLFAPTVAEDVAFGPVNAGLSKDEVDLRVCAALRQVELDYDTYANRSPFELSGGEKRRVAIAGVIAMDPEVLIFDEPTAGLDVQGQLGVQALINTLHRQGKTIILTSHSLDTISQIASTVAVLNQGEFCMLGTPEEVFTRAHEPELKRINLGLPQTAEFARELREIGLKLPNGLFTVEKLADAIMRSLDGEKHGN